MKPIVGLGFAALSASLAVSAPLVVGASSAVAQTVVMSGLDNPAVSLPRRTEPCG
jgi:hypothetical protein